MKVNIVSFQWVHVEAAHNAAMVIVNREKIQGTARRIASNRIYAVTESATTASQEAARRTAYRIAVTKTAIQVRTHRSALRTANSSNAIAVDQA